jgi:hypothetical protein
MQFIVAAVAGALLQICASMVGRVLLALGISFVTFMGADTGIGWLRTSIQSNFMGLPVDALNFLAWLWVDKAISLLFSAYAAASAIGMVGGASFTRMVSK